MRILRFFLNIMMFLVVSVIITFAQIGVYGLTAAQSSKVESVSISSASVENASYFDAYGFWASDLKAGFQQDAKPRIRNWFSWSWWKDGMGWADVALDRTIAFIKPITVPLAQVNAVSEYYDRDIAYFVLNEDKTNINTELLSKYNSNETLLRENLYEYFVVYRPDLVTEEIFNVYIKDYSGSFLSINTNGLAISNLSSGEYIDFKNLNLQKDTSSSNFLRWVANNGTVYNHTWKVEKYNDPSYDVYFTKFVSVATDGTRTIKTPVVVLYSLIYVSFILSFIFVLFYPVSLIQARFVGRKSRKGNHDVLS